MGIYDILREIFIKDKKNFTQYVKTESSFVFFVKNFVCFVVINYFFTTLCIAQTQKTYCNPIDIDYKYNFEQLNGKISYRSGAYLKNPKYGFSQTHSANSKFEAIV